MQAILPHLVMLSTGRNQGTRSQEAQVAGSSKNSEIKPGSSSGEVPVAERSKLWEEEYEYFQLGSGTHLQNWRRCLD